MVTTQLASTCPSCAQRLASCPRSPSCSTAASQRTSSTATTWGKSAWTRSYPPPRKPSCTTLSWRSLRYCGRSVRGVWGERRQSRWGWEEVYSVGWPQSVSRQRQRSCTEHRWSGIRLWETGWYAVHTHWGWWGTGVAFQVSVTFTLYLISPLGVLSATKSSSSEFPLKSFSQICWGQLLPSRWETVHSDWLLRQGTGLWMWNKIFINRD